MIRSGRHNIDGANHVGKRIPTKKYVVRLSAEEREQLGALIRKGKSSAQRLMKVRILLKADVSEDGGGWSDSQIVEALETSATTVYRTRQQLVEEGLEARVESSACDQRRISAGHSETDA